MEKKKKTLGKNVLEAGHEAHAFNPSPWEAEAS